MASRARLFLLIPGLLVSLMHSRAQDAAPAVEAKTRLVAECQMIVLPQKLVLPLLPDLLDEARIDAAYTKIEQLVANDQAEMAGNLVVRLVDGLSGVAATGEELSYATQFDPPNLPVNAPEDVRVLKAWPAVSITPMGFEKRLVGVSLTVTASQVTNGSGLSAKVEAEHLRLVRWLKTEAGKLADGTKLTIEQPVFHSAKSTSSLGLRSGQRVLLGVHKAPGEKPALELFFLRVTVQPEVGK